MLLHEIRHIILRKSGARAELTNRLTKTMNYYTFILQFRIIQYCYYPSQNSNRIYYLEGYS